MQSVDKNGVFGEIEQLNVKKMAEMLKNPDIDRVEVFEGTPEKLKKRKKMVGKKFALKPAYKKAPKIKSRK